MQLKNYKNNKKAFTLAEMMLVMLIVGVLAVILVSMLKPKNFEERNRFLMVYKAIETMQSVFSQIRQTETEVIPTGKFMTKVPGGSYEFTVLNESGEVASASDFAELVGGYMKINGGIIDFHDDNNIKGFKLPGDLYIGIEKFNSIDNCPKFLMPLESDKKKGEVGDPVCLEAQKDFDGNDKKCWGKLHIDINGAKAPNAISEDYYVFGLDEYGIVTGGTPVNVDKSNCN